MSEMGEKWDRYAQLINRGKSTTEAYAQAFNKRLTLTKIYSKQDPDLVKDVYVFIDGFRVAIAGAVFEHEFVHGRTEDPNEQRDAWNVQLNHDWAEMNDIPKLYHSWSAKAIDGVIEGITKVIEQYVTPDDPTARCEVCGESFKLDRFGEINDEIGEFVSGDGEHVIAHSECGLSNGLAIA